MLIIISALPAPAGQGRKSINEPKNYGFNVVVAFIIGFETLKGHLSHNFYIKSSIISGDPPACVLGDGGRFECFMIVLHQITNNFQSIATVVIWLTT